MFTRIQLFGCLGLFIRSHHIMIFHDALCCFSLVWYQACSLYTWYWQGLTTPWSPGWKDTSLVGPATPSPSARPTAGTPPPPTTGSSSTTTRGSSSLTMSDIFTQYSYITLSIYQIPDHPAEGDAISANPNVRCSGWQFMEVPINPSKVRYPPYQGRV